MNLTLFDLDGTLIPKDSDHAFGEFLVELGWADAGDFKRRNDAFYEDYLAGRLDIDAYVEFATRPWRERSAAELAAAQAEFMAAVVEPMVPDAALELVRSHQRAGDLVAIVTATNEVVTAPIACLFGVDELIATRLARDGGQVTGRILGLPAFREGKVLRVTEWLAARGFALSGFERSTFYSDSINDLPLLELVSHAVATHPGPALERIARDRGWPVLNLFS
jgi:HAD superfamily hydrolase (TIGR01490 family)